MAINGKRVKVTVQIGSGVSMHAPTLVFVAEIGTGAAACVGKGMEKASVLRLKKSNTCRALDPPAE